MARRGSLYPCSTVSVQALTESCRLIVLHYSNWEIVSEVTGQIQRKMRENLHAVCQTAAEKMNVLLQRHDLTAFKFDNFLEIVGLANRFAFHHPSGKIC